MNPKLLEDPENNDISLQKHLIEKSNTPNNVIKVRDKAVNLERRSSLYKSYTCIVIFLALEISKQVGNFTLTVRNHGVLPVPTALLFVAIEAVKLIGVTVAFQIWYCKKEITFHGFSMKFFVPAICYFITNLLYLYSLTLTSPPIWMILIQTRVLFTAVMYKIVFGKTVTPVQLTGCTMIVMSIVLTRVSELHAGHLTISPLLLGMSQLSSLLSSVACLTIEMLLKNDSRSFLEQQMWLYTWGVLLGLVALFAMPVNADYDLLKIIQDLTNSHSNLALVIFSISVSSLAGLCVPYIVKNLDSIVKDYLASLNNILLAFLIAYLFPSKFQINYIYAVSLMILIFGIVLYERKTLQSVKECLAL